MYCRVIVQPPVEPLTLAEVKIDRAIDHTLHDDYLRSLIIAAREYCEGFCQRSLVTQTREASFDSFSPVTLELPYGPVQEILAVEYVAGDGTVTAFADYQANIYGDVATLVPAYGAYWPTTGAVLNVGTVRYVAGYPPVDGSPTDYLTNVPASFKTAMRLLVGNWYENREASVTGTINTTLELGVQALLMPYRIRKGMA